MLNKGCLLLIDQNVGVYPKERLCHENLESHRSNASEVLLGKPENLVAKSNKSFILRYSPGNPTFLDVVNPEIVRKFSHN